MRVLQVNKFLYRRGGAEAYMFDVSDLLGSAGHDVAHFGMQHPLNLDLPYTRHFPSEVVLDPAPEGALATLRASARMFASKEAARGIDAVLDDFRPDVVHLHNIYHQLSPSILAPVRARGLPCVMTVHDYKLVCPTIHLLSHGERCEACIEKSPWQAVRKRCKDGSFAKSALLAAETAWHRGTNGYEPIDRFLCPSRFIRDRLRAAGIFPERLRLLPSFVDLPPDPRPQRLTGTPLYISRLHHEKGADVAVQSLEHHPDLRLTVAGDGPERPALERLAEHVAPGRVQFLGHVDKQRAAALIHEASVVVVPSRCYENQPLTVLEAFAAATPVVGSRLGGIAELVEHGRSGLLVDPEDPAALGAALDQLRSDPDLASAMGRHGQEFSLGRHAPERHLAGLLELYAEARDAHEGIGV